jgi:hypothetical protein
LELLEKVSESGIALTQEEVHAAKEKAEYSRQADNHYSQVARLLS